MNTLAMTKTISAAKTVLGNTSLHFEQIQTYLTYENREMIIDLLYMSIHDLGACIESLQAQLKSVQEAGEEITPCLAAGMAAVTLIPTIHLLEPVINEGQ